MKVNELIAKLREYNPEAEIDVVVNGFPKSFKICYGTSDGCTPANCDSVDLMVDISNEKGR
jgi:hypothetical protein